MPQGSCAIARLRGFARTPSNEISEPRESCVSPAKSYSGTPATPADLAAASCEAAAANDLPHDHAGQSPDSASTRDHRATTSCAAASPIAVLCGTHCQSPPLAGCCHWFQYHAATDSNTAPPAYDPTPAPHSDPSSSPAYGTPRLSSAVHFAIQWSHKTHVAAGTAFASGSDLDRHRDVLLALRYRTSPYSRHRTVRSPPLNRNSVPFVSVVTAPPGPVESDAEISALVGFTLKVRFELPT